MSKSKAYTISTSQDGGKTFEDQFSFLEGEPSSFVHVSDEGKTTPLPWDDYLADKATKQYKEKGLLVRLSIYE